MVFTRAIRDATGWFDLVEVLLPNWLHMLITMNSRITAITRLSTAFRENGSEEAVLVPFDVVLT